MNIDRLKALRDFSAERKITMGWWLDSPDLEGYGFDRSEQNTCATAGCLAGTAWIMAGKPVSDDPDSPLHQIGDWATDYLELRRNERDFLFDANSHGEYSRTCSKEEALARLDYLIEHGATPPRGDDPDSLQPWSEWAEGGSPREPEPEPVCA